jgi:hypothetical protein
MSLEQSDEQDSSGRPRRWLNVWCLSVRRLRRNHDNGAHGLVDKLLAGATNEEARGAAGSPSSYRNEIRRLLLCRCHQGVDGLTVNHEGAVRNSSRGERTTPLVLQQLRHLSPVPFRWDNRRSAQESEQS